MYPLCYLSVTSNGLPLEEKDIWQQLQTTKPDKIHLTIHHPEDKLEIERVLHRLECIKAIGIKPGINLLVASDKIVEATLANNTTLRAGTPEQTI